MKLTLELNEKEGNPFGYKLIEIIEFNYDGKGSAICICDGCIKIFGKTELFHIITGFTEDRKNNSIKMWYHPYEPSMNLLLGEVNYPEIKIN